MYIFDYVGSAPLGRPFYQGPTEQVARRLLGRLLISEGAEGVSAGRIVETEAYLAEGDLGCHAARGRTERNAPMYARPGTIYVYLIYGVHCCLNIVTAPEDCPEAVLIRALEPVAGLELMRLRRGVHAPRALCSGPGKLCRAMGISLEHNRGDIAKPPLYITDDPEFTTRPVTTTTRIGLSTGHGDDLVLRYYLTDSDCVSRR